MKKELNPIPKWALEQTLWAGSNHNPIRPKCKIAISPYKSRASQLSKSFVYTLDRYKTFQLDHMFLNIFYEISKNGPFLIYFFLFQPAPSQYKSNQNSTVTSSSQKNPTLLEKRKKNKQRRLFIGFLCCIEIITLPI